MSKLALDEGGKSAFCQQTSHSIQRHRPVVVHLRLHSIVTLAKNKKLVWLQRAAKPGELQVQRSKLRRLLRFRGTSKLNRNIHIYIYICVCVIP